MKKQIYLIAVLFCLLSCEAPTKQNPNGEEIIDGENNSNEALNYGNNSEVGKFANVNGIKMYYEIYGAGSPLVIIHGNGEDISKMSAQIEQFKSDYKVIVADSRGHGKSELNTDLLNLNLMVEDWNALLIELNISNANIYGYSDGGNIAMIIARDYPGKVKKLAIMGSNLRPDSTAIYPWAVQFVQGSYDYVADMDEKKDTTANWALVKQHLGLLKDEPNFPNEDLQKIKMPVLVMVADRDIITLEHTLEIFRGLPNANLAIIPGETHFAPITNANVFNPYLERFFGEEFSTPTSKSILMDN